jgi:7,8-dihydropterin-6-yl-methyl-4-(beta-D-ribofuranosyl)aminobenzene 5'-phosphate synthase
MLLEPVDRLEILVLVDNATDMLSSTAPHVESQSAGLVRRGVRMLASKCLCCAAHGLSCLVTAYRGDARHTVLFDTGPEDYALMALGNAFGDKVLAPSAVGKRYNF